MAPKTVENDLVIAYIYYKMFRLLDSNNSVVKQHSIHSGKASIAKFPKQDLQVNLQHLPNTKSNHKKKNNEKKSVLLCVRVSVHACMHIFKKINIDIGYQ